MCATIGGNEEMVHDITSPQEFESLIEAGGTILLDFYAPWCGPCKMLSPVLNELAQDLPNVRIVKINSDLYSNFAINYGVMSVPTLILVKDGEVIGKKIGYLPKEVIAAWVEKIVQNSQSAG
jgi:thioredoxin 1